MSTPGLWEVLATPEDLSSSKNWKYVGRLAWPKATRGEARKKLARKLEYPLLKVEAISKSTAKAKVKKTWYRAGWCHQLIGGVEVHSELIKLGTSFVMMPVEGSYTLTVWPYYWLPNLTVRIWAFTGKLKTQPEQISEQVVQATSDTEWKWRDSLPDGD